MSSIEFRKMGILLDDSLPDEQKLGYLIGMVHTSINVPVRELDRLFEELEFPEDLRPETPRSLFAFQKAVRNLCQKKTETFIDPVTEISVNFEVEYFVDVLPNDVRQLSRKIQYLSTGLSANDIPEVIKKQLEIYVEKTQKEPEKMALFEFNKDNGEIVRTNLFKKNDLSIAEQTQEKYEELQREYEKLSGCYTERYIKHSWSRVIDSVNAIPYMLANGSVYFFPKAGKEILDKFCTIYQTIHKKDGAGILRIIPVIDTEQQRNYIKHDVEKRIKEKYEHFLDKAKGQLEDISSQEDINKLKDKWGEKKDEFERELKNTLVKQYSELLKMKINAKLDTFVPSSERLQIAKKFMADL
jgi:predicted metal-dependent hydrolase